MTTITTHVLDTSRGMPAAGVHVVLERASGNDIWSAIGRGTTDGDGRLRTLVSDPSAITPGVYRLVFATGPYFNGRDTRCFYPQVIVTFETVAGEAHYHVPLLISPFAFSTYRGS